MASVKICLLSLWAMGVWLFIRVINAHECVETPTGKIRESQLWDMDRIFLSMNLNLGITFWEFP